MMLTFYRLSWLGLVACLAACTTGTPPAAASCQMQQVADLPVRFTSGGLLVSGHLNQTEVQMQLDTGATISMLDQAVAASLMLPADPHRRTTLHGVSGAMVSQNTLIQSLEIGGQQWHSLSLPTGHLPSVFHEAPPVAGLLGADRLSGFDVELDVPHNHMVLWTVQGCNGDFVRWDMPHFIVPLTRHTPNRMITQVQIDGHPVSALIDWGARATTITSPVATNIGVTPEMLAGDRSGTAWGIDQTHTAARLHRFNEVRIGKEVFHNVSLQVADLHLQEVGLLLGADYVHKRRIWLSYATQQMFVAPPSPAP